MGHGNGPIQKRVLQVLAESEEVILEGLTPSEISRRVPGLDRSNRRRAIRGLVARGILEEVEGPDCETRIRYGFLSGVMALVDLDRKKREEGEREREDRELEEELAADAGLPWTLPW